MGFLYNLLLIFVGVILYHVFKRNPRPIFGVYQRPGKWFYVKVLLFRFLLWLRKNRNKKECGDAVGYGVKSKSSPELMDCLQPLSNHPKAIDAVYFSSANEEGYYMVGAAARRPKGVINGFLYLRIPGLGLLESPKLPDTTLHINTEAGDEKDQYGAEGLLFTSIEPMKRWGIRYQGPMKLGGKEVEVDLKGEWSSKLTYFDFDTDMSPGALSRSMAREPWSREYFQRLKEAHQTHYEQIGRIEGTVLVSGKEYTLHLDSMRDHSYAEKREWSYLHRYGFHTFYLEDGTKGNVGIVSQPVTCSVLELGYIYTREGKLVPVDSVDLPLWQHGEGGTPPNDYAFIFFAGGMRYEMQVKVIEAPEFFIAAEREARVVERMATFTCNGLQGWGVAEWEYRNKSKKDLV